MIVPGSAVTRETTVCTGRGSNSRSGTMPDHRDVAIARELAGWSRSLAAPVVHLKRFVRLCLSRLSVQVLPPVHRDV
jgi:hypothetical protein